MSLKNGVQRSAWLDTYDAARAVLPEVLREVLGGQQPVLTVPNRETLLIADRADQAAVRALVEETQSQFQKPRSISQRLLTYTDGVLQPLAVRRDDPLYELVRRQDLVDLAADYVAVQRTVSQEAGIALALPGMATTPAGEAFSFARWQDGVESLLPGTELIALISDDASGNLPLGAFPLERLQAICGELLEQHGTQYPPVFRTRGFPGAAQRDLLGPSLATIGPARKQRTCASFPPSAHEVARP